MSETFQVNLTRASSSQPWGFRLQGGTDFSTPLSVQSVNPGSIAEQCGLRPGDAILQIGNRQSDEMTHEDAKTQILLAGDNVTLLVKRGAVKIWQPKVTPLSELRGEPQPLPSGGDEQYIQKTSLAADKTPAPEINFFNRSARPFPGFGGASGSNKVPVVMNAQYNTPIGMYSTSAALEAFEQQSSALVGDVANRYEKQQQQQQQQQQAPQYASPAVSDSRPAGIRSVKAPTGPPPNVQMQQAQHMTCKVCGSLIIGVFVKIKGEPMHAECFKCVRCGKSLKNQGYFTVEGQLHCEPCAKAHPPGPNMTATAVYR